MAPVIDHQDSAQFERLVECLKSRLPFAILVGAGISAGAGVPTAPRIVRILQRLRRISMPMSYPRAMELAFQNTRERRAFLERTFLGRAPGAEHYLLAHLVENGVFRNIFTTNFDHLTEIALAQYCSSSVRVYPYTEVVESMEPGGPLIRVIKLHGDFLFDSLANTDGETGRAVSLLMKRKLEAILNGSGLIVAGYAGDSSVLGALLELSREPETLTHGIWWIFHQPLHEKNSGASRSGEQSRVQDFLCAVRDSGKPALFIQNANGMRWLLAEACRRVTGMEPSKPPFGVGPGRSMAPEIAPISPSAPTGYRHPTPDRHYDALTEAMEDGRVTLLSGPTGSGKTRVTSRLVSARPDKVFYYSFQFSRNLPDDTSFFRELGLFLEAAELLGRDATSRFWPEVLFDKGGVVVLDDLPVEASLSRNSAAPGHFRSAFPNVLLPLLASLKGVSKGHLVVVRPPHLPLRLREEIRELVGSIEPHRSTEVALAKDAPILPPVSWLRSLSARHRNVLRHIAWLRFAEPLDVLAAVTGMKSGLAEVLSDLVSIGVVAHVGGRYVVRAPHRFAVLDHWLRRSSVEAQRNALLRIANVFESRAADPEAAFPTHYRLEAENAYYNGSVAFEARKWSAGTKMLAMVGPRFARASAPNQIFFVTTLSDYWDSGHRAMFDGLDLRDIATLFSVLRNIRQHASTATAQAAPELSLWRGALRPSVESLLGHFLEWLDDKNPLIARWLSASEGLEDMTCPDRHAELELLRIRRDLKELRRRRWLTHENSILSGRVHWDLCRMRFREFLLTRKARLLSLAIGYARAAETVFRSKRDEVGVDDCHRALGTIYMNTGRYNEARALLLPLLRRELSRPGFHRNKAADLNNLFCTFMGMGRLRLAEGFFHESNYHYFQTRLENCLAPCVTLGTIAGGRNPLAGSMSSLDLRRILPSPDQIANKAARIWADLPASDKASNLPGLLQLQGLTARRTAS